MFNFDLKSAYHYVEILKEHRKYLSFAWDFGDSQTKIFSILCFAFWIVVCTIFVY